MADLFLWFTHFGTRCYGAPPLKSGTCCYGAPTFKPGMCQQCAAPNTVLHVLLNNLAMLTHTHALNKEKLHLELGRECSPWLIQDLSHPGLEEWRAGQG